MSSRIDLAYAAGIIDGEGYIGIIRVNRKIWQSTRWELRIAVQMTTIAIPMWLHLTFGGSFSKWQSPSNIKLMYYWRITGNPAMEFLKTISPYLKEKKGEAEVAIEFQGMRVKKRCRENPKPLWETQVEEILAKKLSEMHTRNKH